MKLFDIFHVVLTPFGDYLNQISRIKLFEVFDVYLMSSAGCLAHTGHTGHTTVTLVNTFLAWSHFSGGSFPAVPGGI